MTDTQEVHLAPFAVESSETEIEIEARLKSEIQSLWSAHQVGKATAKHTKEELKILRLDLGGKLFEMKATLVRTGRGGGWAAYLRSQSLARATVERYVRQYEGRMNPETKRLADTVSEPSEEAVRRLVLSLLPRLRRVLKTPAWLAWFTAELEYQWDTEGASSPGQRIG